MLKQLPDNYFRAGVGAIIINDKGEVLALERKNIEGAWQMPQGGIDPGEEPLNAVYREVKEETNIDKNLLTFVAEHPEWLAYELDKGKRSLKHGRGQVQKWFLLRFCGKDNDIDILNVQEKEFSSWKWMRMNDLISEIVGFKKPVYQKLLNEFLPNLR